MHKPPMLIGHEEIDGVEFARQGGGVLAASAKTFDLNLRVHSGSVSLTCLHLLICLPLGTADCLTSARSQAAAPSLADQGRYPRFELRP